MSVAAKPTEFRHLLVREEPPAAGITLNRPEKRNALSLELMEAIHSVPQPVIEKVDGIATAAGCQLVTACDLAVAAEGARFATPGVKTSEALPHR